MIGALALLARLLFAAFLETAREAEDGPRSWCPRDLRILLAARRP